VAGGVVFNPQVKDDRISELVRDGTLVD